MSYVVCAYFSPFAPHGWSKNATAWAGVLAVPDGRDSGVVDSDGFLTLKKEVRFRGWTAIVERDGSTASVLVECESWENENWLYRPSVDETAGTRFKE